MADREPTPNRRTLQNFRAHLLLTASLVTLGFAAILTLSIFVPIALQLGKSDLRSAEAYGLAQHFLFLHASLWPVVLVSLVASAFSADLLFRRMRSPLRRFVRIYESIAEGAPPAPITIRASDYLTDEAAALNAMLVALRRRQGENADALARLEEAIADLAAQGVPESVLSELQEIAKQLSPSTAGGSIDASTT